MNHTKYAAIFISGSVSEPSDTILQLLSCNRRDVRFIMDVIQYQTEEEKEVGVEKVIEDPKMGTTTYHRVPTEILHDMVDWERSRLKCLMSGDTIYLSRMIQELITRNHTWGACDEW